MHEEGGKKKGEGRGDPVGSGEGNGESMKAWGAGG